jgi:hypothetical protein
MRQPRLRFRFTIGQGMAVIAVLGVIFAVFPMPLAIPAALMMALVYVLPRDPNSRGTPRAASFGCLFGLLGCPVGAFIAMQLLRAVTGRLRGVGDDAIALGAAVGGLLGALTAGVAWHYMSLALAPPRMACQEHRKSPREALRKEIEMVDGLLVFARKQEDEEVRVKLADYKSKLERDLEQLAVEPSGQPEIP